MVRHIFIGSALALAVSGAWAPEVTYDEKKGKLMIYYTMRFRNEANKLYYVYVNDDFDTIESLPQILFEYPNDSGLAWAIERLRGRNSAIGVVEMHECDIQRHPLISEILNALR
jgi:hypothetical protein